MDVSRIVWHRYRPVMALLLSCLAIGRRFYSCSSDKLSVPLTIVLAVIILYESLTWQTITGGLLIIAGTFVLLL